MQKTLKKSFSLSGVCLHSGLNSNITVHPAPADTGIKFKRVDLNIRSDEKIIDASVDNIVSSKLCTSIQNKFKHKVSTIEHLMSALHGLGVDNALIDIDTDEVPILDGSSKVFVEFIDRVGLNSLKSPRKTLKILKSLMYGDAESYIKISPCENLSIDYTISYEHNLIKKQQFYFDLTNANNYRNLIANSRTFGFKEEVDMLRENGLIKGGTLDNAIVLDSSNYLNEEELRFKDEFVRHKILDLIGDFFLIGNSVMGHVEVYCGGHSSTHELLRLVLSNRSNSQLIEEDINKYKKTFSSEEEVSAII